MKFTQHKLYGLPNHPNPLWLAYADRSDAKLCGANLTDASLLHVNLMMTRHDQTTIWPRDFEPQSIGGVLAE